MPPPGSGTVNFDDIDANDGLRAARPEAIRGRRRDQKLKGMHQPRRLRGSQPTPHNSSRPFIRLGSNSRYGELLNACL